MNQRVQGDAPSAAVLAHAATCKHCALYWAQSRALVQAAKRVGQRPTAVPLSPSLVTALAHASGASAPHPRRWRGWMAAAAAVAVSALVALAPASAPQAAGTHFPCAPLILVAASLPVLAVWAALRRRGHALSAHAAAAVAAVGAVCGQALAGLRCPDAHLQRHLLLSHFAAVLAATALAAAWRSWRAPAVRSSVR